MGPQHTYWLRRRRRRARGWGAPVATSKVEAVCRNGPHQHLYPQMEFRQAPAPLADALGSANGPSSHTVESLSKLLLLCWALGQVSGA